MPDITITREDECESRPTLSASAEHPPASTPTLTAVPTSAAAHIPTPPATVKTSGPSQVNPGRPDPDVSPTASTDSQAITWTPKREPTEDTEDTADVDRATENRMVNAHSLAETLLIALHIPYDDHVEEADPVQFTITPPITASKVAAQIAQVSNALIAGTLSAQQANTILFALQTLLSAIRVNIAEEKADRKRTIEPTTRAPRSATKCKPTPRTSRKTSSSPSRKRSKSR